MLTNEDRSELVGETVVLATGSRTITAAAFIAPHYQVYAAYSVNESIISIGKLTAF